MQLFPRLKRSLFPCLSGLLFLVSAGAVPAAGECVGDCDGSGTVAVNEIVRMVNIALGSDDLANCRAGDSDGDGEITVNEIVAAVNSALAGCPDPGTGLGTRRFTLNPSTSRFTALLAPDFAVPLGNFRGQKNGVVGNAFLEFVAGQPDESGVATVDVVDGSDYIFADANPTAPLVLCLRPLLPARNAGALNCNGGADYSLQLSTNHNLGQVGVDGFTAAQCLNSCSDGGIGCGTIEGPNQICAAGLTGETCRRNEDCNTGVGTDDGVCGLGRLCLAGRRGESCETNRECDTAESANDGTCAPSATCTGGRPGSICRSDADCDPASGATTGRCGMSGPHPGACNGGLVTGQAGGDSGPGALIFAPVQGLSGLPLLLSIETRAPCGDEGPGLPQPFALTSGLSRAVVENFSNTSPTCSDGSACRENADCDFIDGTGRGECSSTVSWDNRGQNFSCTEWTNPAGPGCLSLAVPLIDFNPAGGDLIIGFRWCGR